MTQEFTYKYERPGVTVDLVVFGYSDGRLSLLLIKRGAEPFKGKWALPGGFVQMNEDLEDAAKRELSEEAGIHDIYLEQLYTFGNVARDPRTRVISVAYLALVKPSDHTLSASTDADTAQWFEIGLMPQKLAFDHDHIIQVGLKRLRGKLEYEPLGFELLPHEFTLSELQRLYETVLGRELGKRNFRKKILSFDLLIPTQKKVAQGAHRPSELYRFDVKEYKRLKKTGFHFEI